MSDRRIENRKHELPPSRSPCKILLCVMKGGPLLRIASTDRTIEPSLLLSARIPIQGLIKGITVWPNLLSPFFTFFY